jgi:hypothetical protein
MATIPGSCHCGKITAELTSDKPLDQLPRRACQCTFCRRHGALATSDPAGSMRIVLHDPARVQRYRFGLATADFLICGECGVFAGAVMTTDDGTWGILNVQGMLMPLTAPVQPMDYDGEAPEGRIERRKQRWTPCTIVAA